MDIETKRRIAVRAARDQLAQIRTRNLRGPGFDNQVEDVVATLMANLFYIEYRDLGLTDEDIDAEWFDLERDAPVEWERRYNEAIRTLGIRVVDWRYVAREVGGIALIILALVIVALVVGRA